VRIRHLAPRFFAGGFRRSRPFSRTNNGHCPCFGANTAWLVLDAFSRNLARWVGQIGPATGAIRLAGH